MVRRVAVIGAGPSGLASIKSCLEEGLEPVCFESSDDIGGLWRFKEVSEPKRANIYRSLTINTSKEMICFSDFPIPADYPNYMHHSRILQYFRLYAETFKLLQRIRFQTTVRSVRQSSNFSRSGQWEVVTASREGVEERHVFDAVIVCSGHYTSPHLPLREFPGIEAFEGKYSHSWDYKEPDDMKGKRVVVVGIGNSGSDIAVETSRVAEQVYLSTRRGAWVLRQVSDNGLPVDINYNTRFIHILFQVLPMSFLNWFGERMLNAMYDHTTYALKPKHRLFSQIPVINDELPHKILAGSVVIKPNVKEFVGSSVVFEDGSVVEKVDAVVFATGYNYDFSFLPRNVLQMSGHRVALYKHVFPPALEHNTLAVVGFIHALGAIMPQAEMQARWVARVFKGLKKLPSSQAMLKSVDSDTKDMDKNFVLSKLTPLHVDFVSYMDEIAGEAGVRPSLLWLFFTDYPLFKQILWGPVSAFQYRLTGPGRWDGARQAILTQSDRMYQPLKTRQVDKPKSSWLGRLFKLSLTAAVGGGAAYYVHRHPPSHLTSLLASLRPLSERAEPERSSIYRSLVVNTSKEMMCFSDFPMPDHYPNYMKHSQLLQYFRLYSEHFDLLRHIRFQWEVVTEDREGQEERHVFDGVLVCSGHYTHPISPLKDFPGHDTFQGRCCHSWEYKDANALRGKRVLVVGIGNSGGDIAVEISRSAEKTFLSTRKGAWVIGRMSSRGLPLDMMAITRKNALLTLLLPRALVNWAAERDLNHRYDHRLYGLQPTHRLLDRRPLINDDLPGRVLQGALVMKPNLQGFQGSGVTFEDGTAEENIDAVVFCTGYSGTFSFLPASLFQGSGGQLSLYRRVFPPSLERPTLAVMGLFQTKGPIMPLVEMQARWATRVIAGLSQLPPKRLMLTAIETERKRNIKSYPCPRQAALQVDFISYLDSIATEVGVRPNMIKLLLTDPRLGLEVLLGPVTPYQYRLTGPGKWAGARQAILTQWERVTQALNTRPEDPPELPRSSTPTLVLSLMVAGLATTAYYCKGSLATLQWDPTALLDRIKVYLPGP
ncbi:flavin-containing monooxygenase 5-like [Hypomesus transpacificus]|uniref:flavin-containing monooxygenase 5-like n=1 Tax=Hypomesus transpacificus TaxID=137520 RepID=UPI001F07B24F|nr:flavin-containing monooxygenase 5-like [Hypomesus transpacificus]